MSEKSRLLKNTGLITIGNFGAKIISFFLLPLYTSILTTDEYGTYDFIIAISAFLIPVITVCIHEALFRFIIDVKEKKDFNKIVSNSFLILLVGIILLAIVILIIHICNSEIQYLNYLFFYIAISGLYTYSNNLLRGQGKIKEYTIISTAKNVLQLVLNVIAVAVFRLGVKGLLISLCVAEFIPFVVIIAVSKFWKMMDIKLVSMSEIKPMLKYAIPLIPNNLGAQIINISDRMIISMFMGTSPNGIYSVSYKFPNAVETVYHFFYIAWSESASRVWQKGKENALKYYQSLYKQLNNFIFSVIILMIAGMPILFRIFIKGDYIQGIQYVPILLIAVYFDCLAKFYSGIYTALKKTKTMAVSTVIAAIVNVGVNIIFINYIGLYAAAISTLVADIILLVIRYKSIKNDINITIDKKEMFIELLIVIILMILFDYSNYYKIIISILIAVTYSIIANKNVIKDTYNLLINKIKKHKKE